MSKRCSGCGVTLQNTNKDEVGYTPKLDGEYCMRCFRIRHYDDVVISMKQGVDSKDVLAKIEALDALVLWVVDLFDFEANLLEGLNRHLANKDIIMVATKRDLLPITLSNTKLEHFIRRRLKANDLFVKDIIVTGNLVKNAKEEFNGSVDAVLQTIDYYRDGRDVVVMGMANAGKSTLLNALLQEDQRLTTSRHPGTTLDMVEISFEGYILYDTPGITRFDSLLTYVDDTLLKAVIPSKHLKQRGYQLRKNQTLSIAGFARFDLIGCDNCSAVAYFSERLNIHRSKQEQADDLWTKHLGDELLSPSLDTEFKEMKMYEFHIRDHKKHDIVIHGLGWLCIDEFVDTIRVYVNKDINVTFREAMI